MLSLAVLVHNSIILVAGAGFSSGPATDPLLSSGARRPDSGRDEAACCSVCCRRRVQRELPAPAPAGPALDAAEPTGFKWIPAAGVQASWRRLVRSLFRIRRLQRIWGHFGQWLQQVATKQLREELTERL